MRTQHTQHEPPSLTDFQVADSAVLHPPPSRNEPTSNPIGLQHLLTQFTGSHPPNQPQQSRIPGIPIPGTTLNFLGESGIPSSHQQPSSLSEIFRQQEQRSAELFLRSTKSSDNGQGKPLRIVDFVSRLRPTEEEKVISTDSGTHTKLLLSIGHKKPNLENISIEQFSIANLRIFYELLTSSRLPTAADVRDYLSYSIKVFELAKKIHLGVCA